MPPWVYILFYFLIFLALIGYFAVLCEQSVCDGAFGFVCLSCGCRFGVAVSNCRLEKKILLRPQNLLLICIYTSEWIADCRWPGSWVWHLRELELVSPTLFYVSAAACAAKSIFVSRSWRAVLAALYTEQKIALKQWAIYQLNFF